MNKLEYEQARVKIDIADDMFGDMPDGAYRGIDDYLTNKPMEVEE